MSLSGQKSEFKISKPETSRTLTEAQKNFMKILEEQNLERVLKLRQTRQRNVWTGLALGGAVLAIYSYSILAIKQEKFLDDFEEPRKVITETN